METNMNYQPEDPESDGFLGFLSNLLLFLLVVVKMALIFAAGICMTIIAIHYAGKYAYLVPIFCMVFSFVGLAAQSYFQSQNDEDPSEES